MSEDNLNILYKKILKVQNEIKNIKFNKSGRNKFGDFNYFELEDILPGILNECYKEGLLLTFSFNNDSAVLKIRDVENSGFIESNRVYVPPLKEINKKMNIVQSYGAYMTYLKRYLLLNTFLISEDSYIDSDENVKDNMYLKNTPEKQRVIESKTEEFKTPEDYLKFFEKELTKQGLHLNTITLYKMCTKYSKSHSNFKQKEVRELIQKKYGGK